MSTTKEDNLIDKYVHFELPEGVTPPSPSYLTPNKYYKILTNEGGGPVIGGTISSDNGSRLHIIIIGFKCAHLENKTNWIVTDIQIPGPEL